MNKLQLIRSLIRIDSLLKNCGIGSGGFQTGNSCASGGGSGGGGGGAPSYADAAKDPGLRSVGITVSPGGSIKLKSPKTHKDSSKQLEAMTKLLDSALADVKKHESSPANDPKKVKATLIAAHAQQQLQRSMGYARKLLAKKSVERERTRLVRLLKKIERKYKVKAIDPDGGDPVLKLPDDV